MNLFVVAVFVTHTFSYIHVQAWEKCMEFTNGIKQVQNELYHA
jgi:hypothetical protein